MIDTIFIISAIIALVCALITVTHRNVVHALLFMVVMMLAIALIFYLLGAPFAAALQIIVYAGAIMVLFIFVTMMLHQGQRSIDQEHQLFSWRSAFLPMLLSLTLFIEVIFLLFTSDHQAIPVAVHSDTTKEIGILLFGPYHQLVILAALMLLSALIGAIHIATPTKPALGEEI